MSDQGLLPAPVSAAPSVRSTSRLEYVDFRDVEDHREYRFRVYGHDGSSEFRSRIAKAAFEARLVRISDGPDLCYQKLARALAAGAADSPEVTTTIGEEDFLRYRDEHSPVQKHRSSWKPRDPTAAERPRRPQYRPTPAKPLAAPPPAPPLALDVASVLEEGQRVNHAVFGMGITLAASSDRTIVCFDRDGAKSFVTSLLEVEVLSAPHTWETGPRGVNRPRRTADDESDSSVCEKKGPRVPLSVGTDRDLRTKIWPRAPKTRRA